MSDDNEDFQEVWWIFSHSEEEWGGLRIAHFRKTIDGTTIVIIAGEIDRRRVGPRIWDEVAPREGWVKVKQIMLPTKADVDAAVEAALREIAQAVTEEVFGKSSE